MFFNHSPVVLSQRKTASPTSNRFPVPHQGLPVSAAPQSCSLPASSARARPAPGFSSTSVVPTSYAPAAAPSPSFPLRLIGMSQRCSTSLHQSSRSDRSVAPHPHIPGFARDPVRDPPGLYPPWDGYPPPLVPTNKGVTRFIPGAPNWHEPMDDIVCRIRTMTCVLMSNRDRNPCSIRVERCRIHVERRRIRVRFCLP